MNWVWEHSQTKNGARLVMLAIADCANDSGEQAWPSNAKLQDKTNLKERGVRDGIAACVALGELEVDYNAGPGGVNRYRIIMGGGRKAAKSTVPPANNAPGKIRPPAKSAPRQDLPPSGDGPTSSQVSEGSDLPPANIAPPSYLPGGAANIAPVTVLEPSIDHHHPRATETPDAGPPPDDDDDLVRVVTETLAARLGRPVDVDDARGIIAAILEGRNPRNAVAYIRRALEREASPADRWGLRSLPAAPPLRLVDPIDPADQHGFDADGNGSCRECGLPRSNRRHLEASLWKPIVSLC